VFLVESDFVFEYNYFFSTEANALTGKVPTPLNFVGAALDLI
jgi:hypothetical protein